MRFITEFKELHPDFIHRKAQDVKIYAERDLGHLIAKIFGWGNPSASHHRLEIEAFPMDKWVEFKKALFSHMDEPAMGEISPVYILQLIKNLESFGKPSGDTITNQQVKEVNNE